MGADAVVHDERLQVHLCWGVERRDWRGKRSWEISRSGVSGPK